VEGTDNDRRRIWLAGGAAVALAAGVVAIVVAYGGNGHSAVRVVAASATPSTAAAAAESLVCPPVVPVVHAHQRPDAGDALIPGDPSALIVCRYHGKDQVQPYGSLAAAKVLSARTMADDLNGGTPTSLIRAMTCVPPVSEQHILIFGYSDGTRLLVSLSNDGCSLVTNGDLSTSQPHPFDIQQTLLHELGSDDCPNMQWDKWSHMYACLPVLPNGSPPIVLPSADNSTTP